MSAKRQGESPQERITVNLTGRASAALSRAHTTSEVSKTDVVNRSLITYDMFLAAQKAGGKVYIQDADGSDLERIVLL